MNRREMIVGGAAAMIASSAPVAAMADSHAMEARSEFYRIMLLIGGMTANDIRLYEDLPPLPVATS